MVVEPQQASVQKAVTSPQSLWESGGADSRCQPILARMIKDAQRFFRDHQEVLSIAGTVSSAWKLPGTKGAC